MHILKIIHGYPPNYNAGSEVYSQSICNELSKYHKVSVFTREENPYTTDFAIRHVNENENLNFYFVNNPQGKDGYRHKALDNNFANLLSQIKPDVAHIGHLNHLSTGLVDELNKQKIPVIYTLHDFWLMCPRGQFLTRGIGNEDNFKLCNGQNDRKCATECYKVYFTGREEFEEEDIKNWSSWIHLRMNETKAIIDKVQLFIAPSMYLKDRFVKEFGVPDEKIIYLDYGFPTHYLTKTAVNSEKPVFTFGYIGTLIPAKGVNHLIEAFLKIKEPAKLLIFGRENGQSSNALKAIASKTRNTIEFAGEYINQNLADSVFSRVDCIVVPSIWGENSPLVIHEAQACQIPVITANYGGMKELIHHEVNGLLFEHRNIDSLSEQMLHALHNPNSLRSYGARGYIHSSDGSVPNIQNHCKHLEKLYNGVIQKPLWRITIDTNPEDCNLKCIMCEEHSPYSDFIPTLFKETGIKRRRMPLETVKDIFAQAKRIGVSEIIPSTMGEPLLYKNIESVFELAKLHNIKVNLTTNGTFPKRSVEDWAAIIVPTTSDIKISWNGINAETAGKIMLGINFNSVVDNVKRFVEFRDNYFRASGNYCRITFQLTFMKNNMQELDEIVKLAASLGIDRVKGHHLWAHFKEIESLSFTVDEESAELWNNYVKQAYLAQEQFRKPNGEKVLLENIIPFQNTNLSEVPVEYECPFLSKELWVSATGKISPCCAPDKLRTSLGDLGNISETSFEEVLNSKEYQDLVKNYKSKDLCRTCNMRKPI